ncbi:hypothetical protein LNP20_30200 [Klebsiella pneumoniae subsp. pneumoniae]|nr:hypothetical protein [Klebsiella pneumoniae subsp. pneumoniae]
MKKQSLLRQFNAISNALIISFRLVEGDQATSTKVQKWLSGVYDELSVNVNTFKEQIDKNVARLPLDDLIIPKGLTMVNLKISLEPPYNDL